MSRSTSITKKGEFGWLWYLLYVWCFEVIGASAQGQTQRNSFFTEAWTSVAFVVLSSKYGKTRPYQTSQFTKGVAPNTNLQPIVVNKPQIYSIYIFILYWLVFMTWMFLPGSVGCARTHAHTHTQMRILFLSFLLSLELCVLDCGSLLLGGKARSKPLNSHQGKLASNVWNIYMYENYKASVGVEWMSPNIWLLSCPVFSYQFWLMEVIMGIAQNQRLKRVVKGKSSKCKTRFQCEMSRWLIKRWSARTWQWFVESDV